MKCNVIVSFIWYLKILYKLKKKDIIKYFLEKIA